MYASRPRVFVKTWYRHALTNLEQRALRRRPGQLPLDEWPTQTVATTLFDYLAAHFGAADFRYLRTPVPVTDGWETYIYNLHLDGTDQLPPSFRHPLTLRVFATDNGVSLARHEFVVLKHLAELCYPVPQPLLLEESCRHFGGPFLILEQIPGPTLLNWALYRPLRVFDHARQMADLHTQLHQLPPEGFPGPREPLLPRSLAELETLIASHAFDGLHNGLRWLQEHQPHTTEPGRILHMDFHPANLMHDPRRGWVVLDWTAADVGDPHADLATTLMLLDCAPAPVLHWWEQLGVVVGRPLHRQLYLNAYRRHMPVDNQRLDYYRAWAVFRRLTRYGRWLQDGPETTGVKPAVLEHLDEPHRRTLADYFRKLTDVEVHLD